MRILVIGNRFPWPLHDGGAVATYQMLKAMAFEGAEITYFSYNTKKHFVDSKTLLERFSFCKFISVDLDATVKFPQMVFNLFTSKSYHLQRYRNTSANNKLAEVLKHNDYDIVHIEGLYSSAFYNTIRLNFSGKIVYRSHNIEFEIWKRMANESQSWLKKIYLNIQSKRLEKEEQAFLTDVDHIVSISTADSQYISSKLGLDSFLYLPGILVGIEKELELQPNKVFHIGSMEWMANLHGVDWFLQKVWPKVLASFPTAEFHIAGKGLDANSPRYFQSGVYNHGEVQNAKEFMTSHGICIVPIWAGSGIRMKLIEAMSYGIPCITTRIGVQGLLVENNDHLLVASNEKEMAESIIELLKNWKNAINLGKRGKLQIEKNHNIHANTKALLEIYKRWISNENENFN